MSEHPSKLRAGGHTRACPECGRPQTEFLKDFRTLLRRRNELVEALEDIFNTLTYDKGATISALYHIIFLARKHCLETIRKTTGKDMPLTKEQPGTTPE